MLGSILGLNLLWYKECGESYVAGYEIVMPPSSSPVERCRIVLGDLWFPRCLFVTLVPRHSTVGAQSQARLPGRVCARGDCPVVIIASNRISRVNTCCLTSPSFRALAQSDSVVTN